MRLEPNQKSFPRLSTFTPKVPQQLDCQYLNSEENYKFHFLNTAFSLDIFLHFSYQHCSTHEMFNIFSQKCNCHFRNNLNPLWRVLNEYWVAMGEIEVSSLLVVIVHLALLISLNGWANSYNLSKLDKCGMWLLDAVCRAWCNAH